MIRHKGLAMNRIFIIFILIPCYLSAQDEQLEKYIDSLMTPVNSSEMPASLLIIAKDGKPLVRKAYGMANLEMGVPAAPEHLFTLASLNKQMIAVCILQLVAKWRTETLRRYPKISNNVRYSWPGDHG